MTFPRSCEFEKAKSCLDRLSLPYEIISPAPAYERVGVESLVMSQGARAILFQEIGTEVVSSGWVDYQPAKFGVPATLPRSFAEDIFGVCAIMVLAPCVADLARIRLIVHHSGNLAAAFPYLNAEMPQAMFCQEAETFTYMDGHRLISLYAQRITIAKADELVDGWRTLEDIRCRVNETWRRRSFIEPCCELRKKPPALEIYHRLPGTNCRACGEKTCLAFALRLWNGEVSPSLCAPVFSGEHGHLRTPFLEICSSLGLSATPPLQEGE
jgi:ArsR family metal-binding transcriptional regulator